MKNFRSGQYLKCFNPLPLNTRQGGHFLWDINRCVEMPDKDGTVICRFIIVVRAGRTDPTPPGKRERKARTYARIGRASGTKLLLLTEEKRKKYGRPW